MKRCWLVPLCFGVLLPPDGGTVESLELAVEALEGAGWSADGIEVRLRVGEDGGLAASIRIVGVLLPAPLGGLGTVELRCDSVVLTATTYRCENGRAKVRESPLDERAFPVRAAYDRAGGRLAIASPGLPFGGLEWSVDADWSPGAWRAEVGLEGADAAVFQAAAVSLLDTPAPLEIFGGSIGLTADVRGDADGLRALRATVTLADLGLSNEAGTVAAEDLDATITVTAETGATDEPIDYRLAIAAVDGEAYLEPAYLNVSASPLELEAAGRIDAGGGRIEIAAARLEHRGVLQADGSAVLIRGDDTLALEEAEFAVTEAVFPGVYANYLQGFLTGTALAKLETAGRVNGTVRLARGRLERVDLAIQHLDADDGEERLAFYGVTGRIDWSREAAATPRTSRLAWNGGFLYAIGFGAGEARFRSTPGHVSLDGGLRVPVLDGALVVDTLEAAGIGTGEPNVAFDARLEPVSLGRVTTAIGWPALPGKLSGELPLLSVSEGELTLGGGLTARVFDGIVRISDLRIEQPFGTNPKTAADVTMDNLDLGLVTDVFTFGRIEGRLDGSISGLRMLRGRPVAFDADFYTPPDDDSRHRISRRALSNISEIAGGGTALLSSGFLSLFKEFRYDTLGISCTLEGDVCQMSGVRPAENGYYLVKGTGLPRIDVIGHAREVNWPRLLAQISEAIRSREVSTTPQNEEE
ncbi:MAG: hypothetical protein P8172_02565 [Gammaproteobacteria bacterium]